MAHRDADARRVHSFLVGRRTTKTLLALALSSAAVLVGSGCGETMSNTAKHSAGRAADRVSYGASQEGQSKPNFSCPISAAQASEILGRKLSLAYERSTKTNAYTTADSCRLLGEASEGGAPLVDITLWGHPKPEALLENEKALYGDNVIERPDLGAGAYLDVNLPPDTAEVSMLDTRGGGVWQIMVSYGADAGAHKPAIQDLEEVIQLLPE